jgi:hypothetical protein
VDTQDWLTSRPIAHRGLFDNELVPENSIKAFELAISLNHPIEFDVRLTKDGELIVFHDRSLFRLTGKKLGVSGASWQEIQHIPLLGTGQTIPTFISTLAFINGRVPILIEIKNEGCSHRIEEQILSALDRYPGQFAIQSFNPFSLLWFKRHCPSISYGLLATGLPGRPFVNVFVDIFFRIVCLYRISSPKFIAYNVTAGGIPFFENIRERLKVPLILWTVDSIEKRRICEGLGSNYIFEQGAMPREVPAGGSASPAA